MRIERVLKLHCKDINMLNNKIPNNILNFYGEYPTQGCRSENVRQIVKFECRVFGFVQHEKVRISKQKCNELFIP